MALIDKTYFVGELNIPGTGSKVDVQERLTLLINQKEPELLRDILGYSLYKAFTQGLTVDPLDDKWKDLRDGKEYNYYGTLNKWEGLRDSTLKKSLIANYVYYWYLRNEVTQTAVLGEIAATAENSVIASPKIKLSRAWNEMVKSIESLIMFLNANTDIYSEWLDVNQFCITKKYRAINSFGI